MFYPTSGRSGYRTRMSVGSVRTASGEILSKKTNNLRTAGAHQHNTFSPVVDRLDEGTVVEQWIRRTGAGINQMYRLMYLRDEIAGPTVDMFKELPWSEWTIAGLKDKKLEQFYTEALEALNPQEVMPDITAEMLILGRASASLLFDESKGYWTNYIFHDADFVDVKPIPISGFDPLLDLRISPALKQFLVDMDPRAIQARKTVSSRVLDEFAGSGKIPLDPLNTIYAYRKTTVNDMLGTSIYTRLLTFWALEKPLINASAVGARRRAGGITHITAGIDGLWAPEDDELNHLAALFQQADEDPVGAIVATRHGVEVQRLDSDQNIWKWSDDYQVLAEAKMRALGIGPSMLDGDANYTTMETALSVFLERIKALRKRLTRDVIHKKLVLLARANEFVKRKKAEIDHRVRTSAPMGQRKQMELSESELIVPEFNWIKQLEPVADAQFLEILEKMQQVGLPIPLSMWASYAGFDLTKALAAMPADLEMRVKVKKYHEQLEKLGFPAMGQDGGMGGGLGGDFGGGLGDLGGGGLGGGDMGLGDLGGGDLGGGDLGDLGDLGGGGDMAPLASTASTGNLRMRDVRPASSMAEFRSLPIWNDRMRCMDIKFTEVKKLAQNLRQVGSTISYDEYERFLSNASDGNTHKKEALRFLLMRAGIMPIQPVPDETAVRVARATMQNAKRFKHAEVLREMYFINRVNQSAWSERGTQFNTVASNLKELGARLPAVDGPNVLSGIGD